MKEVGEFCGLEFDKKQMKILKNQRTSQINFLMELVNDERITMDEFKDNLFRCNDFMLELVDKKVISKDTYYDKLFLPFKFGAVSMASKSDSYIVPFVITDDLKYFYYRGLTQWESVREYLRDTCLTAQDNYKKVLEYFEVNKTTR